MTEILIKRLSKNISLPKYETDGSSGMDLAANIKDKIVIVFFIILFFYLAYKYTK